MLTSCRHYYIYETCYKKQKQKQKQKNRNKKAKEGKELHRQRLGANNIETGLLSQKVIFLQLQD